MTQPSSRRARSARLRALSRPSSDTICTHAQTTRTHAVCGPGLHYPARHGTAYTACPSLPCMPCTLRTRTALMRTAPHRTALHLQDPHHQARRREGRDVIRLISAAHFLPGHLIISQGLVFKKKDRTKYGPFDLFKFVCGPRESCTNTGVLANEQGRRTAHFGNRLPTLMRFCNHWAPEARH